jgi:L-fuconolactonase
VGADGQCVVQAERLGDGGGSSEVDARDLQP